jgi:hypothetical protein
MIVHTGYHPLFVPFAYHTFMTGAKPVCYNKHTIFRVTIDSYPSAVQHGIHIALRPHEVLFSFVVPFMSSQSGFLQLCGGGKLHCKHFCKKSFAVWQLFLTFAPFFTLEALAGQTCAEAEGVGTAYIRKGVYVGALFFGSSKSRKLKHSVGSKATVDALGICETGVCLCRHVLF